MSIRVPKDLREKVVAIVEKEAKKAGVAAKALLGRDRTHKVAFARKAAIREAYKKTGATQAQIGAIFGKRTTATICLLIAW
jgi:chromosomal replication initiation ATPase DnaA